MNPLAKYISTVCTYQGRYSVAFFFFFPFYSLSFLRPTAQGIYMVQAYHRHSSDTVYVGGIQPSFVLPTAQYLEYVHVHTTMQVSNRPGMYRVCIKHPRPAKQTSIYPTLTQQEEDHSDTYLGRGEGGFQCFNPIYFLGILKSSAGVLYVLSNVWNMLYVHGVARGYFRLSASALLTSWGCFRVLCIVPQWATYYLPTNLTQYTYATHFNISSAAHKINKYGMSRTDRSMIDNPTQKYSMRAGEEQLPSVAPRRTVAGWLAGWNLDGYGTKLNIYTYIDIDRQIDSLGVDILFPAASR